MPINIFSTTSPLRLSIFSSISSSRSFPLLQLQRWSPTDFSFQAKMSLFCKCCFLAMFFGMIYRAAKPQSSNEKVINRCSEDLEWNTSFINFLSLDPFAFLVTLLYSNLFFSFLFVSIVFIFIFIFSFFFFFFIEVKKCYVLYFRTFLPRFFDAVDDPAICSSSQLIS